MSLTLKKDLVIEDWYARRVIGICLDPNTIKDRALRVGTELSDGPQSPILSLAFAMAGFVLQDARGKHFSWSDGFLRRVTPTGETFAMRDKYIELANATIVGHTDPDVL